MRRYRCLGGGSRVDDPVLKRDIAKRMFLQVEEEGIECHEVAMHVPGNRRIAPHSTNRSRGTLGAALHVAKFVANTAHFAHQRGVAPKSSERVVVRCYQRAN